MSGIHSLSTGYLILVRPSCWSGSHFNHSSIQTLHKNQEQDIQNWTCKIFYLLARKMRVLSIAVELHPKSSTDYSFILSAWLCAMFLTTSSNCIMAYCSATSVTVVWFLTGRNDESYVANSSVAILKWTDELSKP